MATDYIPAKEGDFKTWLSNLKVKFTTHAATLGLSPAQTTAVEDACDDAIAEIDAVAAAKASLKQQVNAKNTANKGRRDALRLIIKQGKAHPGYTEAIGLDMGIVGPDDNSDHNNFIPAFTLAPAPGGGVIVDFGKPGWVDGMNIYSRKQGVVEWSFIALDLYSPYIDTRPNSPQGQAEVREYQLRAVDHDEEVGQPSPIQQILVAG